MNFDSGIVEVARPGTFLLAESPVWDAVQQALYWVDGRAPSVHRWQPANGAYSAWSLPEWTGSLAVRRHGGLLLAMATGIRTLDEADGTLADFAAFPHRAPAYRLNDGKCDPAGRFRVGELNSERSAGDGRVYQIDAACNALKVDDGYTIFNGLAWSPDGRTMYSADSWKRRIYAHAYDPATGVAEGRRVFAEIPAPAMPDGATVDIDGGVWVALVDGARLARFAADGRLDREIALPVTRPTSCAFGGPDQDVLYVTTSTTRLSEAELAAQPLAGSILAVRTGYRGLPGVRFAG